MDKQYMPILSIQVEAVKLRVQQMLEDHMDELKTAITAQIEQQMHDCFIEEEIKKKLDAVDWNNWIEIAIDRAVSVGVQHVINTGRLDGVIERRLLTAVSGKKHNRRYLRGDTLYYKRQARRTHSDEPYYEWASFVVHSYYYDYDSDWWAYLDSDMSIHCETDVYPDPNDADHTPEATMEC